MEKHIKEKKFEVEIKGILTKAKYNELIAFLRKKCNGVERDDKITYFFITKHFILKVTHELSKRRAKITVKGGDETEQILSEFEIPIPVFKVEEAVRLFQALGFSQFNRIRQKRINFFYKSFEIAIKYSKDWGYHFEAEAMANTKKEAHQKIKNLEKICNELGIKPMSAEEIKQKIEQINKAHGFIK